MLTGLGSLPSSGRPAWLITSLTSGNFRSVSRTACSDFDTRVSEIPGGSTRLTQIEPSFSSGRNSLPSLGTSARLPASIATATVTTTHRWRKAASSNGRYSQEARRITELSRSCTLLRSST